MLHSLFVETFFLIWSPCYRVSYYPCSPSSQYQSLIILVQSSRFIRRVGAPKRGVRHISRNRVPSSIIVRSPIPVICVNVVCVKWFKKSLDLRFRSLHLQASIFEPFMSAQVVTP